MILPKALYYLGPALHEELEWLPISLMESTWNPPVTLYDSPLLLTYLIVHVWLYAAVQFIFTVFSSVLDVTATYCIYFS